uniref:Uncharacterized protein n=1 Tax=Fagus sylvatica TaxID=28930 RepID=A0A2N9FSP4_FAGSY
MLLVFTAGYFIGLTSLNQQWPLDVHKVSPSRRQLLKNQASPSAPNPDTQIPSSSTGKNAAPLRGSQQKSPPPPSMPGGGSSIP